MRTFFSVLFLEVLSDTYVHFTQNYVKIIMKHMVYVHFTQDYAKIIM